MNKLTQLGIRMLIIVMLPLLFACSSGGSNDFDSSLIPVVSGERYGYVNLKGDYVINPQFDLAEPFFCGLAMVKKGEKYGYINTKGEYVINPQYVDATSFSDGVAWVVKEGTPPTLINKNGEEILVMKDAERCYLFSEGLAIVSKIDKDGHECYGYIDKKGKFVISPKYREAASFHDRKAYVVSYDSKTEKSTAGFIKNKKKGFDIIISDSLEIRNSLNVLGFFHGSAIVKTDKGGKYGIIDKEGVLTSPLQFSALEFDNGELFVCQLEGSDDLGWCDKTGKIVINPQFKSGLPFGNNDLAPVAIDEEFGFINKEGKMAINPQFEEAYPFFDNKVAFVKAGDQFGLIDKNGKFVVNPQFDGFSKDYVLSALGFPIWETVTTRYYDLDRAVGIIQQIVKEDNVDGISLKMSLGKILKKFGKEDISPYSASSGALLIDEHYVPNVVNLKVSVVGDLVDYVSDGWSWSRYPVFNKNAKPEGIRVHVIPTGRGFDKGEELMKAYAKKHGIDNCDGYGANFVYRSFDVNLVKNLEGFTIELSQHPGKPSDYDLGEDEIESDNDNQYTGKIDNKYDIIMNLEFNDDGKVTGSYKYVSKNIPIALEGEIDDDGVLLLEEKTNGKVTGNFAGRINNGVISGVWVGVDGGKELPFKVSK